MQDWQPSSELVYSEAQSILETVPPRAGSSAGCIWRGASSSASCTWRSSGSSASCTWRGSGSWGSCTWRGSGSQASCTWRAEEGKEKEKDGWDDRGNTDWYVPLQIVQALLSSAAGLSVKVARTCKLLHKSLRLKKVNLPPYVRKCGYWCYSSFGRICCELDIAWPLVAHCSTSKEAMESLQRATARSLRTTAPVANSTGRVWSGSHRSKWTGKVCWWLHSGNRSFNQSCKKEVRGSWASNPG